MIGNQNLRQRSLASFKKRQTGNNLQCNDVEIVPSLKNMCCRNIELYLGISRIIQTKRMETIKKTTDQSYSLHREMKFYM